MAYLCALPSAPPPCIARTGPTEMDGSGIGSLDGKAHRIECPLPVGYCYDNDRIMDPRGARELYESAVNSKRRLLDSVGHGDKHFERRTCIADWFMKQLRAVQ